MAVSALLLAIGLGSAAAEHAAPAPSRFSLSRVAASADAVERVEPPLPACSEQAIADVMRLCGGSTGTTCDVVLVGCGVPKRGMGWYHGKQMLEGDVPSATLTAVVEPYFLGPGAESPPGEVFGEWAKEMEAAHGTKFVKDITELEIKVRTPRRLGRGRGPFHMRDGACA